MAITGTRTERIKQGPDKRKKDFDTKIPELKSININSKINLASYLKQRLSQENAKRFTGNLIAYHGTRR